MFEVIQQISILILAIPWHRFVVISLNCTSVGETFIPFFPKYEEIELGFGNAEVRQYLGFRPASKILVAPSSFRYFFFLLLYSTFVFSNVFGTLLFEF